MSITICLETESLFTPNIDACITFLVLSIYVSGADGLAFTLCAVEGELSYLSRYNFGKWSEHLGQENKLFAVSGGDLLLGCKNSSVLASASASGEDSLQCVAKSTSVDKSRAMKSQGSHEHKFKGCWHQRFRIR